MPTRRCNGLVVRFGLEKSLLCQYNFDLLPISLQLYISQWKRRKNIKKYTYLMSHFIGYKIDYVISVADSDGSGGDKIMHEIFIF